MSDRIIILLDQPVGPRYRNDETCFFWGQAPAFTKNRVANAHIIDVPELHMSYIDEKSDAVINACMSAHADGHQIAVVAGSEAGVKLAGQLREQFLSPGSKSGSTGYFRDKLEMFKLTQDLLKEQDGRLRAIPTKPVSEHDIAKLDFSPESPIVVKPRDASGSLSVRIARTLSDLDNLDAKYSYVAQPFIDGDILHVDGLYVEGNISFTVSQYLAPPEGWTSRKNVYASYTVDIRPSLRKEIKDFIRTYCNATGVGRTPFHLELIRTGSELYFLEIGARLGGGPIRDALSVLCKRDINDATIDLYTDPNFELPAFEQGYTGWILVSDEYSDQESLENFESFIVEAGHFVDVRYGGANGDIDTRRFGLALRAIVCSRSEAETVASFMGLCEVMESRPR